MGPIWSISSPCGEAINSMEEVKVDIVADNVVEAGKVVSVYILYTSVVFVIGSFLKTFFRYSSQLCVVYEEVPNPDLLLELCDGIYVARIQGNTQKEYTLYHELIQIFRSPELLCRVTHPKAAAAVTSPSNNERRSPSNNRRRSQSQNL